MGPTERLIAALARAQDPLASGIGPDQVPTLVDHLTRRLLAGEDDLDFSPASLRRLGILLERFHSDAEAKGARLPDDDTARLVREVAAYLGEVLVRDAGGKWRKGETLDATYLEFPGPAQGLKNGELRTYPAKAINAANIAASTWDAILAGVKPRFELLLSMARDKRFDEAL